METPTLTQIKIKPPSNGNNTSVSQAINKQADIIRDMKRHIYDMLHDLCNQHPEIVIDFLKFNTFYNIIVPEMERAAVFQQTLLLQQINQLYNQIDRLNHKVMLLESEINMFHWEKNSVV